MASFSSLEASWLEPDEWPECRRCHGECVDDCEVCEGDDPGCLSCYGKPVTCLRCHGTGIDPADDRFDDDAI